MPESPTSHPMSLLSLLINRIRRLLPRRKASQMDARDERMWLGELYFALCDYTGDSLYDDILVPCIPGARETVRHLVNYAHMSSPGAPYRVSDEDLWEWYALSRVNDYLLMGFQTGDDFYSAEPSQRRGWLDYMKSVGYEHLVDWQGRTVSPVQYTQFFEALGFQPYTHRPWSPFYYEIVEAVESQTLSEALVVDHVYWPGLMFGSLIFSRAGARVKFRSGVMDKDVAENSPLCFTYWRLHRETRDLSHGWGHNSQWRTRFRRDYVSERCYHYNVDGRHTLGDSSEKPPTAAEAQASRAENNLDDLTTEERIELLVNRCFVRCGKDARDAWPYDDRYTVAREREATAGEG